MAVEIEGNHDTSEMMAMHTYIHITMVPTYGIEQLSQHQEDYKRPVCRPFWMSRYCIISACPVYGMLLKTCLVYQMTAEQGKVSRAHFIIIQVLNR